MTACDCKAGIEIVHSLVCHTVAGVSETLDRYDEMGRNVVGMTMIVATRYFKADGTAVVPLPGEISLGVCTAPLIPRSVVASGTNIAAGTQAAIFTPTSAVTSWSHSSGGVLQSVTVTAQRAGTPVSGNTVRVTFGTLALEMFLIQGQSHTWSVAQDDGNTSEDLRSDVTVDCLGNSAATVAWTEHL